MCTWFHLARHRQSSMFRALYAGTRSLHDEVSSLTSMIRKLNIELAHRLTHRTCCFQARRVPSFSFPLRSAELSERRIGLLVSATNSRSSVWLTCNSGIRFAHFSAVRRLRNVERSDCRVRVHGPATMEVGSRARRKLVRFFMCGGLTALRGLASGTGTFRPDAETQ